jgi:DNA polymerase III delta prime subunit
MALRGKQPESVEKRLKALFYGPPGVGKTTAAIQFPKPYLIDTERGAENDQYVGALKKAGGAIFQTSDPTELIAEVTSLLSEKHPYQTLVIDPLTVIYNDLIDRAAEEHGTDFGRHKGFADRPVKRLINLLLRLDMNVIITSHSKARWERAKDAKGKETVVEAGQTFDCYGKLDYIFDLVFEVNKRGKERVGIVRKTRIETFAEGDIFPFSYSEIAERYGRSHIEREASPQELASPEQVAEIERLVKALSIEKATTDKWLDKAKADGWSEMPADAIAKCIQALKNGVIGGTPAGKDAA